MSRYKVEFEFKVEDAEVSDGKWHKDFLDNEGAGFTYADASRVASEIRMSDFVTAKNVDVIRM